MKALLISLLLVSVGSWGASAPSSQVRKRVQENLSIIDENLKALEHNMLAANQNIETLELESRDLSALESQHMALRKKYREILDKQPTVTPVEKSPTEEALTADKLAREKQTRVQEFLALLERNLSDVQSRQQPIKRQIAALKARRTEYQKAATELKGKRAALEKSLNP